jgi:hypothetical protein
MDISVFVEHSHTVRSSQLVIFLFFYVLYFLQVDIQPVETFVPDFSQLYLT